MACTRRTLASSFTHLSRRFHPSFAHILHDDRDGGEPPSRPPAPPAVPSPPRAPYVSQFTPNFTSVLRDGRRLGLSLSLGQDPFHPRFYSSGAEGGSNEIEIINDVAEVLTYTTIDTAAATVSAAPAPFPSVEVAAAAADSFLPVAALQYLIDGVHSFTGLNWWASIAITTILIRVATIPLLLNPMRATAKFNMMRPESEEFMQQILNSENLEEGQKRMKALFQKHGVTPFTPLKRLFIQVPVFINFFLAISNMVEKVPSFKGGGAFWFTDLTTPDPLYMLPVLTSLTYLATLELKRQDCLDGNPMANTKKNFPRVIALMTILFTAHFPKAIFCYWIPSQIFPLMFRFVIKHPPVRKFLDLPGMVPQPTKPAPQPNFSFFAGSNPIEPTTPSSLDEESKQLKSPKRRVSSFSVISQRIRNLEKAVKAISKPKKR